jgi:methylenetetrahydrofolate dehydrogenase (NADP+)/methenyltetrahydrofolate cyclohydrolase
MVLLDGKKTAKDIKDEIAISVNEMIELGEKVPHLAAVVVGAEGAS